MNLKILSLVIIGVCILLPDVCYAFLSKDVHLLNMQNGLADNTVSAVYKDKEGFVWVSGFSWLVSFLLSV